MTFSFQEIVRAMHVSSTPLKNMKKIETNLEAMMKGKQRAGSKSPPKSDSTSSKSKKVVGILLPTDKEGLGRRKADYTSHGITTLPPQLFKCEHTTQVKNALYNPAKHIHEFYLVHTEIFTNYSNSTCSTPEAARGVVPFGFKNIELRAERQLGHY
jgi:hypothetical protein